MPGKRRPPPRRTDHPAHAFELALAGESLIVVSLPFIELAVLDDLTPAEREVVAGIVRSRSNGEIARARGTSVRTLANQIAAVYRKLGIVSRAELVVRCGQLHGPEGDDLP